MTKSIVALIFGLVVCLSSTAQDIRITVAPELNVPLGNMNVAYKSAPGIRLGYSKVDNGGHVQSAYGISVSYSRFQPTADTLYYRVDDETMEYAKFSYSPFTTLHLKGHFDFAFPLGKKMAFTLGASIGLLYGKRDIYYEVPGNTTDSGELVGWGSLNPTAGLEFIVHKNFSIVPCISYTAMLQLGETDPNSLQYNPDAGSFYHFYSPGIAFHVNF